MSADERTGTPEGKSPAAPAATAGPDTPLRRIPAPVETCEFCGAPIVWAITVAGPNGPGGKAQPFNHFEHADGRVALIPVTRDRINARACHKGEDVDTPIEYRGMPHAATCTGRAWNGDRL